MEQPVVTIVLLATLTLLPFLLVMLTSFVKMVVVLAIARNALGAGNIPPTIVVTGLAGLLTLFVMSPIGGEVYEAIEPILTDAQQISRKSGHPEAEALFDAGVRAIEPVRGFLTKHAHRGEQAMFFDLAKRMRASADRESVSRSDLLVLAPAFVTSELKEAFAIGFLLFVPFLIIDMVVANVLLSLGMHMMSPTTVSLPFKLLMFVMVDGWKLLTQGLVLGYA